MCADGSSQLYKSRLYVIVHMGYGRHSILFARMVACNMSGDETDGDEVKHPPSYRIVIAEWQSLELRLFLWALDAKYIGHWEKPPKQRRSRGNPPRTRDVRDESKTVPGIAPCRLWRNCYNSEWLEKLEDWEIELLEIVNEDYDFTLDPPAAATDSQQKKGRKSAASVAAGPSSR
ncbi:hypothetical protein L226DRAFT_470548 [Lentinus tigrinus ALCF2SS1-7]|uniref:uncharacterized protein n=1 Tax=Lentinus tigrinus ALCF2SS1-7 TaxID=1328758 RepID=UPI00116616A2|nr:hypothetical protein L226DRAFT_470548 [Lentinus tigrinus ALCF2SS1-7]